MKNHYGTLILMAALHFAAMYAFMYAMVDTSYNIYPNLNQFYMALLMTSPMVILELLMMGSMYHNRKINSLIIAFSILALVLSFVFIRQQTLIRDREFLKSMIPHHGGAILMCGKASLSDPEIIGLCRQIMASQQAEIDQMKSIMARLS